MTSTSTSPSPLLPGGCLLSSRPSFSSHLTGLASLFCPGRRSFRKDENGEGSQRKILEEIRTGILPLWRVTVMSTGFTPVSLPSVRPVVLRSLPSVLRRFRRFRRFVSLPSGRPVVLRSLPAVLRLS